MKRSNIETLKNWLNKDAEPIRPNKFERKKYKKSTSNKILKID
jgi:hypothetical protein